MGNGKRFLIHVLLVSLMAPCVSWARTVPGQQPTGQAVPWTDTRTDTWTGGGSIGFLGGTPNGMAAALDVQLDRFLDERVSFGPLVQVALGDDVTQVGVSCQGKYWLDLPRTRARDEVVFQGGLGLVYAYSRAGDLSWLVPLGIGYDYEMNRYLTLTTLFLLEFTNLHPSAGRSADVMPGLTFGVRF